MCVVKTFDHLIIGGGMTGDAAISGIREHDRDGSIGLYSAERFPPYKRPPLSKDLWKGKPLERAFIRPSVDDLGVEEHLGEPIVSIDPAAHTATTRDGAQVGYRRLLLGTGGTPKRLPFGDGVIYYRTMADYLKVRALVGKDAKRATVIGGGFIGCEMAAALAMNGCDVTMVFPEEALLQRLFPSDLARHVTEYYRKDKGVRVLTGDVPAAIERVSGDAAADGGGPVRVSTRGGESWVADLVLAGLGIRPNTDLAEAAGITTDDGVVVDERLQTSAHDVWAAGDVARFPAAGLGRSMRVEHEDNAKSQGRLAGENLAGAGKTYDHLPFFYSDLFEMGYEAIGHLDSRLTVVPDWKDGFKKGVVYYLDADRVQGVLLWNVWDAVSKAEELIKSGQRFPGGAGLKGRI